MGFILINQGRRNTYLLHLRCQTLSFPSPPLPPPASQSRARAVCTAWMSWSIMKWTTLHIGNCPRSKFRLAPCFLTKAYCFHTVRGWSRSAHFKLGAATLKRCFRISQVLLQVFHIYQLKSILTRGILLLLLGLTATWLSSAFLQHIPFIT